jgi:nucleolar protein 56
LINFINKLALLKLMDFKALYDKNLADTKKKLAESVNEDDFIVQAITNVEELGKVCNALTKRLRDWFSLYLPEFEHSVADNEAFARLVVEKSRKEMLKELKLEKTMGAELSKEDFEPMKSLAEQIGKLYDLRDKLEKYLEKVMERHCKNILAITGALIGAKLLKEAGSLKTLSEMPASKIQLLGAEEALFRHLKTGAKPPKHGHIVNHPLIAQAKGEDKGKVARALADKISIAAKVDYFKGKFVGDKLRQDLEKRFKV